jgi:hypothetical protein
MIDVYVTLDRWMKEMHTSTHKDTHHSSTKTARPPRPDTSTTGDSQAGWPMPTLPYLTYRYRPLGSVADRSNDVAGMDYLHKVKFTIPNNEIREREPPDSAAVSRYIIR